MKGKRRQDLRDLSRYPPPHPARVSVCLALLSHSNGRVVFGFLSKALNSATVLLIPRYPTSQHTEDAKSPRLRRTWPGSASPPTHPRAPPTHPRAPPTPGITFPPLVSGRRGVRLLVMAVEPEQQLQVSPQQTLSPSRSFRLKKLQF